MRTLLLWLLISSSTISVYSQQDTLEIGLRSLADSVFGQLNPVAIPSGRLFNRLFMPRLESVVEHFGQQNTDTIAADFMYAAFNELREMALDPSAETDGLTQFQEVSILQAGYEFDEDRFIIPIGVIDRYYQVFDEDALIANGVLYKQNNLVLDEVNSAQTPVFETRHVRMIAPLFDFVSDRTMYFYLSEDWIFADSSEQIEGVSVNTNGKWQYLKFGELVPFQLRDTVLQVFQLRVHYKNGPSYDQYAKYTSLEVDAMAKSTNSFCDEDQKIDHDGNKLQWCLLNGCHSEGHAVVDKPFILVTGYRPPLIGQSFAKTYDNYSTYHNGYLQLLRENAFDIFLIRFNIHWRPFSHGMVESALLLKEFLQYVNARKASENPVAAFNENVIQGSSMGSDIVRLALLMMEKEHWEQQMPHHHTRLFIAYDGNLYGANIPLSYQCMLYSNAAHPRLGETIPLLGYFLYTAMEQKATKELLCYHAVEGDDNRFHANHLEDHLIPQPNSHRTTFLSVLSQYDNGQHIVPIPLSTRNIAISLGKIGGTNNLETGLHFNEPGDLWVNYNSGLAKYLLRSAKYDPPGSYTKLFHRRSFLEHSLFIINPVNHQVHVTQMQEIDNAAGSYLSGSGNIIAATNWALFPFTAIGDWIGENQYFTHKPVVTALAINKNLWPANGTMSLNVKSLGLMFTNWNFDINDPNDYSNYFGYPHLGHPNDHYQITPFDAIYIDNKINPHINLEEDVQPDSDNLRDFLLNEIEPWYLGLQNWQLGSQSRTDMRYRAKRRAFVGIVVGKHVTPSTPDGAYSVEANADLILTAGRYVELLDGFSTEFGATLDVNVEYEQCNALKALANNGNFSDADTRDNQDKWLDPEEEPDLLKVFPNPSQGSFTVRCSVGKWMNALEIRNITGTLVLQNPVAELPEYVFTESLQQGTYIVSARINGKWIQTKLVVL